MRKGWSDNWPMWDEPLPISADITMRRCLLDLMGSEPWATLPADDLTGELRQLAAAVINPGCDTDLRRRRRIEEASREHGRFRRAQQVGRGTIAMELATLRDALFVEIQSCEWGHWLRRDAMTAVGIELELACAIAEQAFDVGVDGTRGRRANEAL